MKWPEILVLPVLMLSDYFLTVLGAVQKEKRYDEYFKMQHYELNPLWQKQIQQKKWFNPRHILITFVATGCFAAYLELGEPPSCLVEGFFGTLFVFFAMIIGRHLSNLCIFGLINRRTSEISGQLRMAHSLSLAISVCQYLVAAVPIAFIAVFSPTPFVLGGVLGAAMMFLVHWRWLGHHKKQQRRESEAKG